MVASLLAPMASSLINAISGKWVMIVGKGQEGGFLPLLELPLMIKAMSGKGVTGAGRRHDTWIISSFLFPLHPLSNTSISKYFNYEPRFNGVFQEKFDLQYKMKRMS